MKRRSQRKLAAKRRRGVLMIVILSILVLFALIALTFVVVAGQFRSQAASFARHELTDEQGRELIEQTFRQLLRGTNDTNSPLFDGAICNSLLEDLYGPNWVKGAVSGSPSTSYGPDFISFNATGTFSDRSDYYSGQVLTFLDGPCAFLSTRIVRFEAPSTFHVEAFQPGTGAIATPTSGNNFLINGRPFSGQEGVHANESFDAPTALDPHLAYVPANTTTYFSADTTRILPSFAAAADVNINSFTGSVATASVDNDRDGLNDSVWIDPKFPIKFTADGRRYKPYVAVLCVDLDGRLNLNAHGCLAQNDSTYTTAATRFWSQATSAGGTNSKDIRPRGMGTGVAEVNPNTLLGLSVGTATSDYAKFLEERYRSGDNADRVPGARAAAVGIDQLFRFSVAGMLDTYPTASGASPTNYLTQLDHHGRSIVGVDYGGRPITHYVGVAELTDPPYEMNLIQPDGTDTPYSVADLEGVLRYNDGDRNALSQRIFNFTGGALTTSANAIENRRMITTHSSRIPVPSVPFHIIDRTAARMGSNYSDANIRKLLPMEVLRGGKMDLNRPWGNGLDNSGNNVVDDPGELATAENVFADIPKMGAAPANYAAGVPGLTNAQGRYQYARNLYCLMMVLLEANYRANFRESITDDNQLREMTARRVAQWAVNVVDFRDADAIMTPFEYDVNPFNGWEPDGIVTESGGVYQPDGSETRLVWGCEHPDVIFTESLGFHDRRVRDTDWDDNADAANEDPNPDDATRGNKRIHKNFDASKPADERKKGDKDLDQVRIPQGSLFLELYATRNVMGNNAVYPRELYVADGSAMKLNLAAKDAQSSTYPVWRIAISSSHHTGGAAAPAGRSPNSPDRRRISHVDSTTFQPEAMSYLDNTIQVPLERYIWFTNTTGAGFTQNQTAAHTFYNKSGGTALLEPGRYAIIGPRAQTYTGAQPTSTDPTALATGVTTNSDQVINLNAGGTVGVDHALLGGESRYPFAPVTTSRMQPPLRILTVTESPYEFDVGLNISEPLPNPSNVSPLLTSNGATIANAPYLAPTHTRLGIKDAYGDGTPTGKYQDKPFDSEAGRPLKDDDILDTGTVENYRTAFLQRLANPLIPWNAATNPYITVDWIPLDLTVFNGEDRTPTNPAWNESLHGKFDPSDDTPIVPQFTSRERDALNPLTPWNIWSQNTRLRPATNVAANLGLAMTAREAAPPNSPGFKYNPTTELECFQYNLWHSLGYANGESVAAVTATATNNLRGHRGGSGSLLGNVIGPVSNPAGDPYSPYPWITWNDRPFTNHMELLLVPASSPGRLLHELTPTQMQPNVSVTPNMYDVAAANILVPHGHLLNFLHNSASSGSAVRVPHYYRLLDFVEVPSRYVGTRKWCKSSSSLPGFAPPFNYVSRFREPGVVNINTVTGDSTWRAIDGYPTANAGFTIPFATSGTTASVDGTRRGAGDAQGRFSNPFRSVWADAGATSSNARSLLRADGNVPMIGRLILWESGTNLQHRQPDRHAYFFYQGQLRFANMLTTQSNVYAVWVTVGYFEVDGSGVPLRELNSDTGEVTRHRGFYLLDRSIPVAYERGQDHNVDQAVLLRRYVE